MDVSSCTPTQAVFVILPDELIYQILLHSRPCDIITRFRLVSKKFSDITWDVRLWRILYATAPLLRPSGPFSWQSTRYLERTLVQSERVSRMWTSQTPQRIPVIQVPCHRSCPRPYVICGRFCVWCEERQAYAQDIETGVRQLLWERDEVISSFEVSSLHSPEALRVFLIIREPRHGLKILAYSLKDDNSSFEPVNSGHEIHLPDVAESPATLSDDSPFMFFRHMWDPRATVVDKRTCSVCVFPSLDSNLVEPADKSGLHVQQIVLAGTYIVAFLGLRGRMKLVQIYTDIRNQHKAISGLEPELRLTHEIMPEDHYDIPRLIDTLRAPVIDSVTGDTILMFFGYTTFAIRHYQCVSFIIPSIDPDYSVILPFRVETQELFPIHGSDQRVRLEASSDGYARGAIVSVSVKISEISVDCYRFSVDASGEKCSADVSKTGDSYMHINGFDLVRGRSYGQ